MGDNYSPPQEGPNMPYILTPAQQQLAGILQLKQQQQQQLEQQHGMHHPQLLQQQLIYLQQQQLLQQQQQHQHQHELNYRLEMQQHSLNGHHKQKKFGDHNNQSPMDHDKPIPPKPKIKVHIYKHLCVVSITLHTKSRSIHWQNIVTCLCNYKYLCNYFHSKQFNTLHAKFTHQYKYGDLLAECYINLDTTSSGSCYDCCNGRSKGSGLGQGF